MRIRQISDRTIEIGDRRSPGGRETCPCGRQYPRRTYATNPRLRRLDLRAGQLDRRDLPRIDSRLNDSREVIGHLEQLDREVLPLLGREYDGERRRRLRDNIEPHRFQITARKGVVRVGNRSAASGLPSKW